MDELSIWVELLNQIAQTAAPECVIHFYALPESNVILLAQKSPKAHLNLHLIATGMPRGDVVYIQILVTEQKQISRVEAYNNGVVVPLQMKKTSEINDLFKSYVCLFTNLRLDCVPEVIPQYYAIIQDNKDSELIFTVTNNVASEVREPEIEQKQSKKPVKKHSFIDAFTRLQNLLKNQRNTHKDQLDQLGKITSIKHPLITTVGIFIPQSPRQLTGLHIVVGNQPIQTVVEWITYHKYDKPAKEILEDHLRVLESQKKQNHLYFNDQICVALTSDPSFEEEYFLLKHKQLQSERYRLQATKFETMVIQQGEKLLNVHQYLSSSKALQGGQRYTVRGDYVYHHYMQDGFDDKGWGCAYRSFMTVLSWLILNGYCKPQKIPSHREIQSILVSMDDKPREFIDSCEWIGAFEVNMLINKLTQIDSKILHISNGPDIVDKLHEFKHHFVTQGSPIMFGGGVYAYTMLGLDYDQEGQCKFLILDPHYIASDNIKTIIEKGGISWKNLDMFLPGIFYNFCMPLVQ